MAKRFLALLLAVLMLAALSASAFADSDVDENLGTITISNAQKGEEYTAYKIFDVTYDDSDPKNYAYTITSTSPWFKTVSGYADENPDEKGVYSGKGLTLTPAANTEDPIVYFVTVDDDFKAADFAKTLKGAEVEDTGRPLTVSGEQATVTDLELGYWFVKTKTGALCNLTTTDPNATIVDKNEPLTIVKVVDDDVVEVGQEVTYTVTADLPKAVTGYTTFKYEIRDELPDGLKYEYITKVKIGDTVEAKGSPLPEGSEFTQGGDIPTPDTATLNGFDVTVNLCDDDWAPFLGKQVEIEYKAIVTDAIVGKDSVTNTAHLKYTMDPQVTFDPDDSETYKHAEDSATIYSLNLDVTKVSSKNSTTYLEDAEFVLYKQDESSTKEYYLYGEKDGLKDVQWVKLPKGKADVSAALKADPSFCTKRTTDSEGKLDKNFEGLDAGTYYLEEIKSPLGYALSSKPFKVVVTKSVDDEGKVSFSATVQIDGDETSKADAIVDNTDLTVTATIKNVPGQKLPETGGIGTTIFYVLSSMFVLGAAAVYFSKKRA